MIGLWERLTGTGRANDRNEMKRHALALGLLLLLPASAWAQPAGNAADLVTGVDQPLPGVQVAGINPSKLKDYLTAVQAVQASVTFSPTGQMRRDLGTDSIQVDSTWRKDPQRPSEPARLVGLTLTPARGQTMAGDIEKVTVDGNGRIRIQRDAFIGGHVTISKITRDRNGDLRLHVDQGLIPDITVRQSDGKATMTFPFGIKKDLGNLGLLYKLGAGDHWPPRLDDLAGFMEGGNSAGPPVTGTIAYNLNATADAAGLPLPAQVGNLGGTARVVTNGRLVMAGDGTIKTDGPAPIEVELRVGSRNLRAPALTAGEASGHVTFKGRYGVKIPTANLAGARVVADGDVTFALEGRKLVANLPEGATVMADAADVRGSARLRSSIKGGAGTFTLSDGTYRMGLHGPVGADKLALPGLVVERLRGTGELTSTGTFSAQGDKVTARGDLRGRVTATEGQTPESVGFVRALEGNREVASGKVRAGSTIDLGLNELAFGGQPVDRPNELPDMRDAGARGKVKADLRLGDVRVNDPRLKVEGGTARVAADLDVNGGLAREGERLSRSGTVRGHVDLSGDLAKVTAPLPDGSLSANGVHVEGGTDLAMGENGVDLTNGRLKARVDGGGTLETGLPGMPVRPSGTPVRRAAPVATGPAANRGLTGVVANMAPGSKLNLRAAPDGQILGKLASGAPLRVLNQSGDWSQVETADGRRGYVSNRYLNLDQPAAAPVAEAPAVEPAVETPAARPAQPGVRGRVSTAIAPGTEAEVALDRAHLGRDGVSAAGRITAATVVLGATDLRSGDFQAKILGSARASLQNVGFSYGPNGLKLDQKVSVPVRVELAVGSRVTLGTRGRETEVTIDRPGSYAEFTAQVSSGQGGVSLDELTGVDVKLVTTATARLLGDMATVPGEKSLEVKGRVAFVPGGFDVYGSMAIRVTGDANTPILRVRM